jgi:hypothetical protein
MITSQIQQEIITKRPHLYEETKNQNTKFYHH